MFENLKAFIRQGKQANDIRKNQENLKHEYHEDNLSTDALNLSLEDKRKHDNHGHNGLANEPSRKRNDTSFLEEKTKREHYDKDRRYDEVASHIVEQENLQRKQANKYPNLENYELFEQMGEGAFSVVYKARHIQSNTFVAIKILRKFQMDKAQKQSVFKEATIMRQLDHPNIVKFIEFIELDDYFYIVQELVSGGEIFTAIVNFTYFSGDLTRHVITQVAKSVRYLHEEVGVVHRDIKPENLLYTPIELIPSLNPIAKLRKSDDPNTKKDEGEFIPGVGGGSIGVVKLADFGLSKQIWEQNTKTPCGTVGYTAPEIVRDERYSKEVDMWALGCVLYTLLCGFPPFYDERIETLTEKVAKGEYTFLSPWWDEISDSAKYCVSKLLTVDPSKRYTIDEFLNDPWMLSGKPVPKQNINSPLTQRTNTTPKYSKRYTRNAELYSPALAAMREAFDISTAVHRMGEEAANQHKDYSNSMGGLVEEEDEEVDEEGQHEFSQSLGINDNSKNYVIESRQAPRFQKQNVPICQNNVYDLNLKAASILERRKNKQITLQAT